MYNFDNMSIYLDRKTKILLIIMFIFICGSVVWSTNKYLIQRDFLLFAKVSCDPSHEMCFVQDCDTEEDIRCPYTGDYFYKFIYKSASDAPKCISNDKNLCQELICIEGEDCEVIYCSEENLELYELEDSCAYGDA